MRISCLCVTEDRPEFIPWLVWNFEKQTYPNKELVVIDSSKEPIQHLLPKGTIYRHIEHHTYIPVKRNLAMDVATGDLLNWMDDDDWQHPQKCEILVKTFEAHKDILVAGSHSSYFLNLRNMGTMRFEKKELLYCALGIRREYAQFWQFPAGYRRASDSWWITRVMMYCGGHLLEVKDPSILYFSLCHGKNISNPASKRKCQSPLSDLQNEIGSKAWGNTDDQIRALLQRLP